MCQLGGRGRHQCPFVASHRAGFQTWQTWQTRVVLKSGASRRGKGQTAERKEKPRAHTRKQRRMRLPSFPLPLITFHCIGAAAGVSLYHLFPRTKENRHKHGVKDKEKRDSGQELLATSYRGPASQATGKQFTCKYR